MESITFRRKLAGTGPGPGFSLLILLSMLWILAVQFGFLPVSQTVRIVVVAGICVALVAVLIESFAPTLAFWSPRGTPADNFLRLDGDGLTHTVRGRARRWRWSEISDIRQRWRRVVVSVPDDERVGALARWRGRLTGAGPRLVVRDDYVLPIDGLAARLDAHRASAHEAGRPAAKAAEPADRLAALPPLRIQQRRPVEVTGVSVVVAVSLLPLLVIVPLMLWRDGFSMATVFFGAFTGALILLIGVVVGAQVFAAGAKRANYLSLDPSGLRYTRGGTSLAWPWHELSPFELRPTPPQPWYLSVRSGRIVAFSALGDGQAAPHGLERLFRVAGSDGYAIQDIYDTPLDEIAAKLNDYREQALDAEGADAHRGD